MDSSIKHMERSDISAGFRRQVYKVIGSIVLFMIVYLLLVTAAIGLAFACCWLGVFMIARVQNLYAIVIALGCIALGISVIVFLFKFIFAVAKDENSQRLRITEKQQPRLFAFIRQLTKETHTPMPKTGYVSPDVNAAGFYHSSFWSMFLPTGKNLEIGLGLVNCVNSSEFKAVMAHEFGHFSQRSMRLLSFTYNVNRIIHNMLYDNTGYAKFLNTWARLHGAMAIFAKAAAGIARGIQWVLRRMYTFINLNYKGLSREMEFHADAVAAGVAGGCNLVSALSRADIASNCFKMALNEAGERAKQNKVSRNIFSNQLTIFRSVAEEYELPLINGLPEISYSFVASFSRSRVNFKNQWASHPTLQERAAHLGGQDIPADKTSAWSLFEEPQALQETVTANLYQTVKFEAPTEFYDAGDFDEQYRARKADYALPAAYKGFYDGRYLQTKDWDIDKMAQEPAPSIRWDELFNEETGQLQSVINSNKRDAEVARAIGEGKIDVKSFDFDGVKYAAGDAKIIAEKLENEIGALEERQRSLDRQAFLYFLHRPGCSPQRLVANYSWWRQVNARHEEYVQLVNRLMKRIGPLYAGGLSLLQVQDLLSALKEKEEPELKQKYRLLAETGMLPTGLVGKMQAFADRDYAYFIDRKFQNAELEELKDLAIEVAGAFNEFQFRGYKKMLVEQLEGDAS